MFYIFTAILAFKLQKIRPNKKKMCVSGKGSENFRFGIGTHIFLFYLFICLFIYSFIYLFIYLFIYFLKKDNFMHFERPFKK